ncbi:MAG: hypothetical protein Q8S75_09120, partial [Nitrospirota bacterium]|nr:hypothetical protein [Nitrospirota bacterium]
MKPCSVTTCPESRKDSQLACAFHWSHLPVELRRRLMLGYHRYKGSPAHLAAVGEAMAMLKGM